MDLSQLGSTLKGQSGDVSVDSLKDLDYIGFYFSAHWCPPCRQFTPVLAKFYNELKATDKGKSMEIIFVTCDRDADKFQAYFKEMPWLAVPFEAEDIRSTLSKKHNVSGIPYFVLVNAKTGEVITTEGRSKVTQEPANFPWA
ncbi:tryparedoxin-like [Liolophura sinensis]|uniref:tryparedoxin-like n=1 Tax=Liolophura sinensis TaxID=3198878 RepID=UPI00315872C4